MKMKSYYLLLFWIGLSLQCDIAKANDIGSLSFPAKFDFNHTITQTAVGKLIFRVGMEQLRPSYITILRPELSLQLSDVLNQLKRDPLLARYHHSYRKNQSLPPMVFNLTVKGAPMIEDLNASNNNYFADQLFNPVNEPQIVFFISQHF